MNKVHLNKLSRLCNQFLRSMNTQERLYNKKDHILVIKLFMKDYINKTFKKIKQQQLNNKWKLSINNNCRENSK